MNSSAKNILIVDDHVSNRKLLRATLEVEGFNAVEACDGLEALEILGREPVDAIISDILMPRMDGYRLCYEVRANQRFSSIPLIIYTNTYTSQGDEETGLNFGADKYLRRPAHASEIIAALQSVTEGPQVKRPTGTEAARELGLMKQYSDVLVNKLEKRNTELERASEELARANNFLVARNDELQGMKDKLAEANTTLERRVRERTSQLEAVNQDLEAFSHSVAHDLLSPLRAIDGYARVALEDCGPQSNTEIMRHLKEITQSVREMHELIQNLLRLSRINRSEIKREPVNLGALAAAILCDLEKSSPGRPVEAQIASNVTAIGDGALLRIALENLLNNAWKFSANEPQARIEIGLMEGVYFVRDNGAGFDMNFAHQLFVPFQRLHSDSEFKGTGIGLTIVQRIIHRHGGSIWANSAVNKGATFYFTLEGAGNSQASAVESSGAHA